MDGGNDVNSEHEWILLASQIASISRLDEDTNGVKVATVCRAWIIPLKCDFHGCLLSLATT